MMKRRLQQIARISLFLAATTMGFGPCNSAMVDEFREVASDDVATGLKNIANGLIDGFFSALDPGNDAVSSGTIGTTPGQSK